MNGYAVFLCLLGPADLSPVHPGDLLRFPPAAVAEANLRWADESQALLEQMTLLRPDLAEEIAADRAGLRHYWEAWSHLRWARYGADCGQTYDLIALRNILGPEAYAKGRMP